MHRGGRGIGRQDHQPRGNRPSGKNKSNTSRSNKPKVTTVPETYKPKVPFVFVDQRLEMNARNIPHTWQKVDIDFIIGELKSSKIACVIFLDLDNVPRWLNASEKIPPNVLIWGFCGQATFPLSLYPFRKQLYSNNRLFVTVCGPGRNSADFGITFHAAEANNETPPAVTFILASRDNDFRYTLGHLRRKRERAILVQQAYLSRFGGSSSINTLLQIASRTFGKNWLTHSHMAPEVIDLCDSDEEEEEKGHILIVLDDTAPMEEGLGGSEVLTSGNDDETWSKLQQELREEEEEEEAAQYKPNEPLLIDLTAED
ncbi:hypothetical protein QOT17_012317 [Balamuthia mandrillaris]